MRHVTLLHGDKTGKQLAGLLQQRRTGIVKIADEFTLPKDVTAAFVNVTPGHIQKCFR